MAPLLLDPTSVTELSAKEPAWMRDLRTQALATYQSVAYPTARDEAWRRTDPERVRPSDGAKLVPDQHLELKASGSKELAKGVTFCPIDQAPEELAKKLMWQIASPATTHAALNGAFFTSGTFLHVPKDTSALDGYLESSYRFGGDGVALSHSLIQLERGAKATLVESFAAQDHTVLAAPVVEIDVQENAHLTYVVISRWGKGVSAVPRIHARVGKDAHLKMLFVDLDTSLSKCFIESDLVGQGAKSEVLGVVLGEGRQHYDIDVQQNHRVGNTVSDVLFHVALTDRSRSVFAGNILCEPGAQKIDGYQQNRNLLLSDKARADSMPRLEIEANDVRCTHGASFTTFDANQRYYLQTRGLTAFEAEHLLITGFFASVIERLDNEALEESISAQLGQKLESALQRK